MLGRFSVLRREQKLMEKKMIDILNLIVRHAMARKAENQLRTLPDYILKDIGITRGEISYAVRERKQFDRM